VTSKWVHRLVELGEVQVSDWRVFSLELVNGGAETLEAAGGYRAAPALRTAVMVRQRYDADAVGRFYHSLDRRTWERSEDIRDPDVVRGALDDAGLDSSLYDAAIGDAATWETVIAEHRDVVARFGAFGVPTIALDGGSGPGIFGPVISVVPADAETVELWRHVLWLMRSDNFWELKRSRAVDPDLEGFRVLKAKRALQSSAEPDTR
jgi:hypothetical protein